MSDAVFFDLWNTLLFCPTSGRVNSMIAVLGLDERIAYQDVIDLMGKTIFVDKSILIGDFVKNICTSFDAELSKETLEMACDIWVSRLDSARYFEGVEETLKALGKEHRLGLISNIDASGMEFAREFGILDFFDDVFMSCELGYVKPDPHIFDRARERLDAKAEDCWMVGDNLKMDVLAPKALGWRSILVDWEGINRRDDIFCVEKFIDIADIIDGRRR